MWGAGGLSSGLLLLSLLVLIILGASLDFDHADEANKDERVLKAVDTAKAGGSKQQQRLLPQNVPDIFIIGAQKCGTTSLNNLMFDHPQICSEGVKEKHFYDHEKEWLSNQRGYLAEFKNCKKNQLTIDATPVYIFDKDAPFRIQQSYSQADLAKKKFILLLREPVARQYSEYQRVLRICFRVLENDPQLERDSTSRTVEEKYARAETNCYMVIYNYKRNAKKQKVMTFAQWQATYHGMSEMGRGRYLEQIERWLTVIDRSQLFILNFVTLIKNTTDTMVRMADFIGVDVSKWYDSSRPADTKTKTKTKEPSTEATTAVVAGAEATTSNASISSTAAAAASTDTARHHNYHLRRMLLNAIGSNTITLPQPPASNKYVEWAPGFMDCSTHDKLYKHYAKHNVGLIDFINNASNKPSGEPFFPPFESSRPKCQNATDSDDMDIKLPEEDMGTA